jgi:hypothetical protein
LLKNAEDRKDAISCILAMVLMSILSLIHRVADSYDIVWTAGIGVGIMGLLLLYIMLGAIARILSNDAAEAKAQCPVPIPR